MPTFQGNETNWNISAFGPFIISFSNIYNGPTTFLNINWTFSFIYNIKKILILFYIFEIFFDNIFVRVILSGIYLHQFPEETPKPRESGKIKISQFQFKNITSKIALSPKNVRFQNTMMRCWCFFCKKNIIKNENCISAEIHQVCCLRARQNIDFLSAQ